MSAPMARHCAMSLPRYMFIATSAVQCKTISSMMCNMSRYQHIYFPRSNLLYRPMSRTVKCSTPLQRLEWLSPSKQPFGLFKCNWKYPVVFARHMSSGPSLKEKHRTMILYICAIGVFMVGMTYAGVPLYRMFCQATGLGGKPTQGHDSSKVETMTPVQDRLITVKFNADVASSMRWNFKPQQTQIKVAPGETALAFYTAKNPCDKPVIGISTYNIIPFEAGLYFNKIQCFCFEEQRLNPHEQVDMPVFFFIDPEFAEDPKLQNLDTITLSYTFFEAKEGLSLPLPGYMQPHHATTAS